MADDPREGAADELEGRLDEAGATLGDDEIETTGALGGAGSEVGDADMDDVDADADDSDADADDTDA